MFSFFKRKQNSPNTLAMDPIEAKAAKNLADLSNQALTLRATEDLKSILAGSFITIKKQASLGKKQARIMILCRDYEYEIYRQVPNLNYEINQLEPKRVEAIGLTSKYLKTELEKLGYIVTISSLNLQIRRVAGDTASFFAGHDITIHW